METVTRTVLLPILKPLDGDWDRFGALLRDRWQVATRTANHMMSALAATDQAQPMKPDGKFPPCPVKEVNLYRLGVESAPSIPTHTISAIDRMVRRKWTGKNQSGQGVRWASRVGLMTVPTFRYPAPFPIKAGDWKLSQRESGELSVTLPLSREGKGNIQHEAVILKCGGGFRPMADILRRVLAGELKARDCKVIDKSVGNGKACPAVVITVDLPKSDRVKSGDMIVATCPDALLRAGKRNEGRQWWFNAHHLPRLLIAHKRRMKGFAEDAKHETRHRRNNMAQAREVVSQKYGNAIKTVMQQAAAKLAGNASRRGFARVVYDDSERGYLSEFQWAMMATIIRQKLESKSIEFVTAADVRQAAEDKKATAQLQREWSEMQATLAQLRKDASNDSTGDESAIDES